MTAPVARSASSCPSSTTITSDSGSSRASDSESIASIAWLVTTTSASRARSRAISAQQSSANGHRCAPRHSCGVTDRLRQARSSGAGTQLVAVAGLGGLGPLADPHDVASGLRRGRRREERVLVVRLLLAGVQPVQAQVVAAALEHRERRTPPEQRLERVDQPRQVAVDQLALQGDGGRGDDRAVVVRQHRHQVGQRLAGAGAGLHQQVLAGLEGVGDRLGHLLLALARRPADRGDGGVEQRGGRRRRRLVGHRPVSLGRASARPAGVHTAPDQIA